MFVVPWVLLFIAAVGAGLVCFGICTRIEERRWERKMGEYAALVLDTELDDTAQRWRYDM